VTLISPTAEILEVAPEYCQFQYRDSYLKRSGDIVTKVRIRLRKGDIGEIRKKSEEIQTIRTERHPVTGCSAGCFFKNIPDQSAEFGKVSAGKLLEEAGAKQLTCGGAKVWEKHANIIVNTGTATSADIRQLANMMKQKVQEKFGITLEEEVIQLGTFH
jgi:UDP-N-acetylmuramate dehydrogenase